jgi:predicted deacetylase
MKLEPARYLLRFDDLCPTMSKERFERFREIIERHQLQPILGVVPDNQDPELIRDEADPTFWDRMCALQSAGSVVAMHGYRYLCLSNGRSIVGLCSRSEFAGVPREIQRHWIHTGLVLLRERGLNPRLFVAPRHGFDSTTIQVLTEEGLPFLSDGFAQRPFSRAGVCCIPQQLWAPIEKRRGLWTICIHTSTASDDSVPFPLRTSVHYLRSNCGRKHAGTTELMGGTREWILLNRQRVSSLLRQHSIRPNRQC